jgi:ectoine hydroxylase-related dioxygenase (phytanoyl-CoA dioxygenase family)
MMSQTATFQLAPEQVEQFHEDGFLRLEAITTQDEVDRLAVIYDDLFEGRRAVSEGDRLELAGDGERPVLPQIMNPERYAPELLETVAYANAASIARALLGDEAAPAGMHAIRKPARHGAETPWHQDEAYWAPTHDHNQISIWMPLQPATLQNGCMQFVRGSQHDPVRAHRLISPDAHGLVVDEEIDQERVVACPIAAGGATVHNGRTLHYAGPNATDGPRRALIMAFQTPGVKRAVPHDYHWQRPEWYADS